METAKPCSINQSKPGRETFAAYLLGHRVHWRLSRGLFIISLQGPAVMVSASRLVS